jgi:superfamily II DNA or RNA helicase/HJR/Mrr/RecB family endonuclease
MEVGDGEIFSEVRRPSRFLMPDLKWRLAEPSDGLVIEAEESGVWIRRVSGGFSSPQELRSHPTKTRLGRLLPTTALQMLDADIATLEQGGLRISHQEFARLEQTHKIDAFDGIVPWAPFTVEVETTRWPGDESFRYFLKFYAGRQVVDPNRIGSFVLYKNNIHRLDPQTYSLVEAINSFNALPPERKLGKDAFIRFSQIKDLAEGVGAQLDEFLLRERVIVPSSIGLDLVVEPNNRISFAPKVDGVPQDAFREAFMASDEIEEVYSMDDESGGRVRVVLDEPQREVLKRMQCVRHLGGAAKSEALRDPAGVFDGVEGSVDITFGPRVQGVGDFPFVARPYLQGSSTGIFEPESPEHSQSKKIDAGIKISRPDGTEEDIKFSSRDELLRFHHDVKSNWENGRGFVEFKGKTVPIDERLITTLGAQINYVSEKRTGPSEADKRSRKYLLIYTNEDQLEFEVPGEVELTDFKVALPKSLESGQLKEHQLFGLEWLQRNFCLQRNGCLLADEMGLGKTLQVLTFLAWAIEQGELAKGSSDRDAAPWDPILIVTPVTLLENETWIEDMRRFFVAQGSVFQPWLVLHGTRLREYSRKDVEGRETEIGRPKLDLEKLRQNRVIFTNYETVVNYQHSFAKMKDRLSIVVTDEAQEYKTPSTKISHALKSLSPRFRVACTGTPVETRLLDVWNIFDFLQPGQLLGSAKQFTDNFEKPTQESVGREPRQSLSTLRSRLRYGSRNAFVLRRDKRSLQGLPKKHEHRLSCTLSLGQREWHLDLVQRAKEGGPNNHPFGLLQQLMLVYQHPSLIPRYDPPAPEKAIKDCPKLAETLAQIRNIRLRGEKVLLFARSLNMQDLLKRAIEFEFGIDVDILNGQVARRGSTKGLKTTRKDILARFKNVKGFNAIVLSPDVAGVGLTLTEANHVIHYGRWWNPAKEAQATDRVYRIGQTKDVHVYYLIATDPKGLFDTFDQKLDAVIERRRELASEFLAPMPSEEELQHEIFARVVDTPTKTEAIKSLSSEDVRLLPWDRFEALIALLEEKRGAKVILTPRGGDDKADVIAVRGNQIRLVQCKHSLWSAYLDSDVVADVIGAIDLYRVRYLRNIPSGMSLFAVIVSNGTFTTMARKEASDRDVEVVGDLELWKLLAQTPCTRAELEVVENRRAESMRDVQAALKKFGM